MWSSTQLFDDGGGGGGGGGETATTRVNQILRHPSFSKLPPEALRQIAAAASCEYLSAGIRYASALKPHLLHLNQARNQSLEIAVETSNNEPRTARSTNPGETLSVHFGPSSIMEDKDQCGRENSDNNRQVAGAADDDDDDECTLTAQQYIEQRRGAFELQLAEASSATASRRRQTVASPKLRRQQLEMSRSPHSVDDFSVYRRYEDDGFSDDFRRSLRLGHPADIVKRRLPSTAARTSPAANCYNEANNIYDQPPLPSRIPEEPMTDGNLYDTVPYQPPPTANWQPQLAPPDTSSAAGNRNKSSSMIELSNLMLSSDSHLLHAGAVLRATMVLRAPNLIRDRTLVQLTYPRCMVGSELVEWFIQQYNAVAAADGQCHRIQAVGIGQALLERGILNHVNYEYPFLDKYLFYRWADDEGDNWCVPTLAEQIIAEKEMPQAVHFLSTVGPDALFRMVLQKTPEERATDELEVVYEELLHVQALSHLSTMVKRELAAVIAFEQHANAGTVLFRQGDEGKSWYIILKGSVDVHIHGKGVVTSLKEGDDFGKLALVNDAPRAATVVLREDNCHFLRVDKHDFNRILRDVEANTVRLREHDQDVLVLEKIPCNIGNESQTSGVEDTGQRTRSNHRYSVMAGKPEKVVEYLLETRVDSRSDTSANKRSGAAATGDNFLETFLLTHQIFLPSNLLVNALKSYYENRGMINDKWPTIGGVEQFPGEPPAHEVALYRGRVVQFLQQWIGVVGLCFFQDSVCTAFVEELYCSVMERQSAPMGRSAQQMEGLRALRDRAMQMLNRRPVVVTECGVVRSEAPAPDPVLPFDTCVLRIHGIDGTYIVEQARIDRSAADICRTAAVKLGMGGGDGVELVELKSSGEKVVFNSNETSIPTMLSLNGRLFAVFADQIESLVPLPEQRGPAESASSGGSCLDLLSSGELAYQLALHNWNLLSATHESELVHHVFGRDQFAGKYPVNLDLLNRRFIEIQHWVMTEVVLCRILSKRVQLVRKFIKIALHSKMLQDLLTFFAIILGLSNIVVSRLQSTWEKLPTKLRKQYYECETLLDPCRNHRSYRIVISKMEPPIIPFVPLLLKDLTFIHDGNKTLFDGLVNFEKMNMVAQVLRVFRRCKSKQFGVLRNDNITTVDAQHLVRNLQVIDDQKRLMVLSQDLEPSRSPYRN